MLRKRISELMNVRIIEVPINSKVLVAIEMMRDNKTSCILVLKDKKPLGIFTERNIVQNAIANRDFIHLTVGELMRHPVLTAKSDMYVFEAFHVLLANNIRHLVIVDEHQHVIGTLSQSDIIEQIGNQYLFGMEKISQMASSVILTMQKERSVLEALTAMDEYSLSAILVTEKETPLGILTERDAAAIVIGGGDIEQIKVSEVMSSPVKTLDSEVPVYEAARVMKKNNMRRVGIVDKSGKIIGLLSQSDIIKGLEMKYIELLNDNLKAKELELKEASKDLHEKTVYLDGILHSALDMGIIAVDINFNVVYFNPAAEELLGQKAQEVIGSDARKFRIKEEKELFRFDRILKEDPKPSSYVFSFERELQGEIRLIESRVCGIWDQNKTHVGYVLTLLDITERKKAEDTIRYMAYHDNLTGLANRSFFDELIDREIIRAGRNRSSLAIMIIDLDRFKNVNDTLGHHVGDLLLKAVSDRMFRVFRRSDVLARVGGDEFYAILPDIGERENTVMIAEKIIHVLESPFKLEGTDIMITVSIGISLFQVDGLDAKTLMRVADHAMYKAKELNRENFRSNVCSGYCIP
ncbi:MAG: diguanylate cyclase [Nitrospirae bacterium]|nr:diguanylate cyclase [Nitrospirota bacterium]